MDRYDTELIIRELLSCANRAPSTHNSQPWLFNVVNNGSVIEVHVNKSRTIPHADPLDRDRHISIGCAIENLLIAADQYNIDTAISYDRINDSTSCIAEISLDFSGYTQPSDTKNTPLLEAINNRQNARGEFTSETIPQPIIDSIVERIGASDAYGNTGVWVTNNSQHIEHLAELTAQGVAAAYNYKSFRKEMSHWMHNSLSREKTGLHGYALHMPLLLSFIIPSAIRFFNIGNLLAKLNYTSVVSAPTAWIITLPKNSPLGWVQAGRAIQRIFLELTRHQYQASVFSAAIEMGDLVSGVNTVLDTDDEPQLLFVAGKIKESHKQTKRESIDEHII